MDKGMFILYFAVHLSFAQCASYKTVLTPSGPIRGIGVETGNSMVYQYRKIPFAKPPVGDLRFRKPLPFGGWKSVLDATSFGPSCFQDKIYLYPQLPNHKMSEDCLHLNIFTSSDASPNAVKSVMVWIHGGGFVSGQSSFYDATNLANLGDVIVVTVNYRLGYLGFLSTGDDVSRGNYGLWDQRLAIQWVKYNIQAFGGDPDHITIFGESAGGFSVALQALNPNNRGLFERVIIQSGPANSQFAMHPDAVLVARGFGISLRCIKESDVVLNTTAFVECLREKSAEEIINAQRNLSVKTYTNKTLFGAITPVIDNDMIVGVPENTLTNHTSAGCTFFRSLDVMIGNTNAEGSFLITVNIPEMEKEYGFNVSFGIPRSIFCNVITTEIAKELYHNNERVSRAICDRYGNMDSVLQARNAVNMYTDAIMVAPTVRSLDSHSSLGLSMGRNTFQYIFAKEYQISLLPIPSWFRGAWHAAELPYLFGPEGIGTLRPNKTRSDVNLSDIMTNYWANFAKIGFPSGPGVPYWPRYDPVGGMYMVLDTTVSAHYHVSEDDMKFWNQYLPKIIRT